jgi:hypothetical protein
MIRFLRSPLPTMLGATLTLALCAYTFLIGPEALRPLLALTAVFTLALLALVAVARSIRRDLDVLHRSL